MKKNLMIIALGLVVVLPAKAQWTKSSHGYLSHSSHHTQEPTAIIPYVNSIAIYN